MFELENVLPAGLLNLQNANVTLAESPSTDGFPAATPVHILQADQDLEVNVSWTQHGWLTNLLCRTSSYKIQVLIEQIGMGEVPDVPAWTEDFVPGDGTAYSVTIPISDLEVGVYKMVVTLMFCGPNGTPTPIAAFHEMPNLIQVFPGA